MNYKDLITSKNFSKKILSKLKKEFGYFEDIGIVAGQAVASAVYEELGIVKGSIYNDLDIFYESRDDSPYFVKERKNITMLAEDMVRLYNNEKTKLQNKENLNNDDLFFDNFNNDTRKKLYKKYEDIEIRTENDVIPFSKAFFLLEKYIKNDKERSLFDKLKGMDFNGNEKESYMLSSEKVYVFLCKKILRRDIENGNYKNKAFKLKGNVRRTIHSGSMNSIDPVLKEGYSIQDSEMQGKDNRLNYISIIFHNESINEDQYDINENPHNPRLGNYNYLPEHNKTDLLINAFDINMCQVGIDLKTNEIRFTEQFINFLYNKNIEVTYAGTPAHTPLRLIKKSKDYPWTKIDIDTQIKNLKTVKAVNEVFEQEFKISHTRGTLFLEENKEKISKNNYLMEHYNIEKKINIDDTNFYSISPKGEINSEVLNSFKKILSKINKTKFKLEIESMFFIKQIELYNKLINIKPKDYNQRVKFINDYIDNIDNNNHDYINNFCNTLNIITNIKNKITAVKPEALNNMLKVFHRHPDIFSIYSDESGMSKIALIAKRIRWLEKNDFEYVIGKIENKDYGKNILLIDNDDIFKENLYKLDKKFKEMLIKNSREKVLPSNAIENISSEFKIKELCNEFDLTREGSRMKHCVGGYWQAVKNYNSLIYSIKDKDNVSSTVEFKIKSDGSEFAIVQHRGRFNSNPDTKHLLIAKKINKVLNENSKEIKNKKDDAFRKSGLKYRNPF